MNSSQRALLTRLSAVWQRYSPGVRALVIEHDEHGPAESVGDRLEERGFELEVFLVLEDPDDPVSHKPFPDATEFDALVVTGSPWSLADPDPIGSWIHREVDMVRAAHDAGTPILGMCFGGQVISRALDGSVTRVERPEFGWCQIEPTNGSPLLPGPWFQWHFDVFTVPEGAVELARNDFGPQAFRIGHSLGTQFHPEITPRLISDWLDHGTEELAANGVSPQAMLAETVERADAARGRTADLVDWFLAEVAGF